MSGGVNLGTISSGRGENLRYIIDATRSGYLPAEVKVVLTDQKEAGALKIAQMYGIKHEFLDPAGLTREEYDLKLMEKLEAVNVELLILTGYMRLLSSNFVRHFRNRILNIHPALLPSFRGINAFQQALDYGVKWSGVTIHLVDEQVDHGPIIYQQPVRVKDSDTYQSLKARIQRTEHAAYPKAIKLFIENRPKIDGRRIVFNE